MGAQRPMTPTDLHVLLVLSRCPLLASALFPQLRAMLTPSS